VILAPLLLLAACRSEIRRHEEDPVEVRCNCGRSSRTFTTIVYEPPGFDDPARADERWPLLLYLPGTLTFGHDIHRLASGDPPEEIEKGRDFPMVVITAMATHYLERWHPRTILALIDHAIETYRVDPDRVYLTGVSIGGLAVWDTAIMYPERIAAIAPVASWGHPLGIERMVDVPVWAFHGAVDFAIPMGLHRLMIEDLRKAGGNPRWTVYPDGFHWIWERTYAREDLYAWMLDQSLAKRREAAASGP